MIKFVKTQSALTIFRKTGPEMVTNDNPQFDRYLQVCSNPLNNEEDLNKIDGDFSFEDDLIGVSFDRKTGRSEIYFNGQYIETPINLISIFKKMVRDEGFPPSSIASFLLRVLDYGISLAEVESFILHEISRRTPEFETRGRISRDGKIETIKIDENEIENHILEKYREIGPVIIENQRYVNIIVGPEDLEFDGKNSVYAPRYFVVKV
jgi:hypothetical protein